MTDHKLRKTHGACAFFDQTLLVEDDKLYGLSFDPEACSKETCFKVPMLSIKQKIPAWIYPENKETVCNLAALASNIPALVVAHRKENLSPNEVACERTALREGKAFSSCHIVRQLDARGNIQWETTLQSYLTCLSVSDDAQSVLVGLWGTGLAYDPAEVKFLNAQGRHYASEKTESNIEKSTYIHAKQLFKAISFNGYVYKFGSDGHILETMPPREQPIVFENYAGDNHFVQIIITDKKRYSILVDGKMTGLLTTTAQINEVSRLPGATALVLRIGTKKLQCVDFAGEALWEWISKDRVTNIAEAAAAGAILVEHGDEVTALDNSGTPVWTIGLSPNADHNLTVLKEVGSEGHFLIGAGDVYDYRLLRTDRTGKVLWEFSAKDFRDAKTSGDGNWVFAFCNRKVVALEGI